METTLRISAVVALCVACLSLFGATVTWEHGAGTDQWKDAANWSPDQVPGPNDDVLITTAGNVTVRIQDVDPTVNQLTIQDGASLIIVAGNKLTVTSSATIDRNGTLYLSGSNFEGEG